MASSLSDIQKAVYSKETQIAKHEKNIEKNEN